MAVDPAGLDPSTLKVTWIASGASFKLWRNAAGTDPFDLSKAYTVAEVHGLTLYYEGLSDGVAGLTSELRDATKLHASDYLVFINVNRLGNLTAYRPYIPYFPKTKGLKHTVPDGEEENPGVGIRRNGDDDDEDGRPDYGRAGADDRLVPKSALWDRLLPRADGAPQFLGDDDLVRVDVSGLVDQTVTYKLKRSNDSIRVYYRLNKDTDFEIVFDAANVASLTKPGQPLYVEWAKDDGTDAPDALLTLVRRDAAGTEKDVDTIRFRPFNSITIALGGELALAEYDPSKSKNGAFQIADELYQRGFNIYKFDEDKVPLVIGAAGPGVVYDLIKTSSLAHDIKDIAIFGHSHGGGATYLLATRIMSSAAALGSPKIVFTGYIDAIRKGEATAQTEKPPGTAYHVNLYQTRDAVLRGASVAGSNVDINVNEVHPVTGKAPGVPVDHGTIDNHIVVRERMTSEIVSRVKLF